MNINIENHISNANVSVEQKDDGSITVVVKPRADDFNKMAVKDLQNPNSELSKALSRTYDLKRRKA